MYDLTIRNGAIIDGTRAPRYQGDIGIRGDRIAAIGDLSTAESAQSIDAKGKIVAPGFVETDMTSGLDERILEGAISTIPLKRFGSVDDIAEMVAFICSEKAGYITGQVFTVDGGMVM